jgi:hypothetical protein
MKTSRIFSICHLPTSPAAGVDYTVVYSLARVMGSSPSSQFYGYTYTANEGSVRIQYKFLVPIDVFPEMKLLFPKQNYNVLSPNSYTHISVRDLYISRIGLPILLQGNMWIDP